MKTVLPVLAGIATLAVSSVASAAFTGLAADSYINGDFAVVDLYACYDSGDDVTLNAFNADITNLDWNHDDFLGPNWSPVLALSDVDSFVAIGGTTGAGNSTSGDPNFENLDGASIPDLAGWFPGAPPNLQGQAAANEAVGDGFYTLLGRFVIATPTAPASLDVNSISLTYNQGLGTPAEQTTTSGSFAFVPAPGALALLGLAGLAGSRRRRA